MVWLLVLAVYAGPADSTNWNGPWDLGMFRLVNDRYASEAACRNAAIQTIGQMHQGMLAPMRYKCVGVSASLPKGAPR